VGGRRLRRDRVEESRNRGGILTALPPEGGRPLGAVVPEVLGCRIRSHRDQPNRRVRALCRVPQQWPGHRPKQWQCLGNAGCLDPARMHAFHANVAARQSLCPRVGEHHLHSLGSCVHPNTVIPARFRFQVIDGQRRRVHATRRHEHHRGARGVAQQRQQPFGHQVRTQDMGRQLALVRLRSLDSFLRHRARVVHQSVESVDTPGEVIAPRPHRVEVGDVADLFDHHRAGNGPPDRPRRPLDLLLVATQQVDGRAESGQRGCDRLADSHRRAGDDHPLPGHGLRAWA